MSFFLDTRFELAETDEQSIENSGSNWKEIAMVQSMTINDLRKKVKILQQKIRRQSTKIRTLKVGVLHIFLQTIFQ